MNYCEININEVDFVKIGVSVLFIEGNDCFIVLFSIVFFWNIEDICRMYK